LLIAATFTVTLDSTLKIKQEEREEREQFFFENLNSCSPFLSFELGRGCGVAVNIVRTWPSGCPAFLTK